MAEELKERLDPPTQPSLKDDFYGHVNHQWLQETYLPTSESRWNVFDRLRIETAERLRNICEASQGNGRRNREHSKKGSNTQLLRDYYASAMDMDARNKAGLSPLQEYLTSIDQISESADIMGQVAKLHLINVIPFFDFGFAEDSKKAGSNAYYLSQGGLGLPNRDYYLEEGMQDKRDAYIQYIAHIFRLSGRSEAEAKKAADSVLNIERSLAEAKIPREQERDVVKNYHKFTLAETKIEFPNVVDFSKYFTELGIPGIEDFIVEQPDFMRKVGALLQTTPLEDIKDYLTFTLLNTTAHTLSEDFVSASFAFHGQILTGQAEQKPLWQRTIKDINGGILSQAIGPIYCEKYFNNADKERVMGMVGNITAAFAERIQGLEWMSEETKTKALEKLANITFKMGYPEQWIDISQMDISNGENSSYTQNYLRATEFEIRRYLARLTEPYDRSEWHMQPTVVNARADLKRSMTFPAAILQPPFYNPTADEAYNYGAIGAVVGHELSHFFDDQGCEFDVDGNLNNWWNDKDRILFTEGTQQFIEYYGNYKVYDMPVNGKLTLGENIADVAGVAVAYDALQKYLREHEPAKVVIDGMTPEQRFFTGFARIWASKITQEKALEFIKRDAHSPDTIRVNAALSAFEPFYKTFGVKEGDLMYVAPELRPGIW